MKRILGLVFALGALLLFRPLSAHALCDGLRPPGYSGTQTCEYKGTIDFDEVSTTFEDVTADDDITAGDDLTVTDDATITDSLTVNGNATLGNAATDTQTFTGAIITDDAAFPCRNETGGAFANGDFVRITGWSEAQNRPLVVLADNDATLPAHGVLTATLANNTNGTCYRKVRVDSVNTAGRTVGDAVYLTATATSTNTWTFTAPAAAAQLTQILARVSVVHASTGSFEVDLFNGGELTSITTAEIAVDTLVAGDIATGAVATAEILDATIVQADVSRQFGTGTAPGSAACGTTPTFVGSDMAFTVTVGTGDPNSCVIDFNATFTNAPVCVANVSEAATAATGIAVTQTATALTIDWADAEDMSGDKINVICFGQDGG